jgi:hypothetical protein
MRGGPPASDAAPRSSPDARAISAKRPDGVRASTPRGSPAIAAATFGCGRGRRRGSRIPRSASFSTSRWLAAAIASLRHDGPSIIQSRSPASSIARHVSPRGRGASLRVRTRPPGLSAPFPRACPGERVQVWPSQAYESSIGIDDATGVPPPPQIHSVTLMLWPKSFALSLCDRLRARFIEADAGESLLNNSVDWARRHV